MIGMSDDNKRILDLIKERMAIGENRYGHGIRRNDDTTQWGTKTNSWTEMGLEEALDLTIYLSAQLIRIMDIEQKRIDHVLKMAKRIKELEHLVVDIYDGDLKMILGAEIKMPDMHYTGLPVEFMSIPQDNDSEHRDTPLL